MTKDKPAKTSKGGTELMTAGSENNHGLPEGLEITGITADSRRVEPGFLFAAIPSVTGSATGRAKGRATTTRDNGGLDGRDFIKEAIAKGASAILTVPEVSTEQVGPAVSLIHDANPRRRYARLCGAFYGAHPDTMVAVTGTNGKTSVAEFTRQIWQQAGFNAASLGTLGVVRKDAQPSAIGGPAMTTPDPADLQKTLASLAADGVRAVAMEASSHGLDQYRLDGIRFSAAAFTNLSRDHLDYHGTMEAYRASKLRLFEELLGPEAVVVVNTAAREHDQIINIAAEKKLRTLGYGLENGEVRTVRIEPNTRGFALEIDVKGERFSLDFPLPGRFQIENALAAYSLAYACGLDAERCIHALGGLSGVRGRLERAASLANGASIYVDYAHTPDAIETALKALRVHTKANLHIVFGCGGDRDPGKRPLMGKAAAIHADQIIVTDDNPRSEDASSIRKAALQGCPKARDIGDRRSAIRRAIKELGPNDILCIAGKGHEQGQQIGDTIHPFDDVSVVRDCIQELKGPSA